MRRPIFTTVLMLMLAAGTARAEDAENVWPKTLTNDKGEVVLYQPQIESLEGDRLEARAAVMVKMKGKDAPVFGAMWFQARIATDMDTRMATLDSVTVTDARFPEAAESNVALLSRYLEQEIPKWNLQISIDRLVADLDAYKATTNGDTGFKHDPPVVEVRDHPSVLVIIDGDPIWKAMDGPKVEFVVNTAFFIVREPDQKTLYLRGSGMWFTTEAIAGPWTVTTKPAKAIAELTPKLEEEEKKQAAAAAEDAEGMAVAPEKDTAPPEIIVSTKPAELLVTDGKPDFASVEGTQLLYLSNTESDVLMEIESQQYYVLLAGRWYQSADFQKGPWTYVEAAALPADFKKIPEGSDLATVLPSVPDTQQAREAVLDASIPQTAEIDRKTATLKVAWDGDPEFEACTDAVARGKNADKPVLLIDGTYYACDTAVWFVSEQPDGPWKVATEVPAVIQDLPPECPVYNVKYVHIYDSTPEVVYVGYTPGYYGSYVYNGVVVYGTGWIYHPWYHHHYYPSPVTFGFGVHYNPWTGWGFSFGVSYGWLSVGVGWGHPAYHGWGPGGYRMGYRHGYWHGYNNGYRHGYNAGAIAGYRDGNRVGHHGGNSNLYRQRDNGVKRTGDLSRNNRAQPGVSDRKNDVFTDRDGNVYRDRGDGNWDKRENGQWKQDRDTGDRPGTSDRPTTSDRQARERNDSSRPQPSTQPNRNTPSQRDQLNRDRDARNRGNQMQRQAPQRSAPRSAPRGGGRGGGGRRG